MFPNSNSELVTFEKELYSGIAGQIRKDVSFESD